MENKISALPEKLPTGKLRKYFIEVIEGEEKIEKKFEYIKELADKQWHNYELIDSSLRNLIHQWIQNNLSLNSPRMLDDTLSVISCLGLQQTYEWLKKCKPEDCESQRLIDEAVEELGDDVSNPYINM